MRGVDKMDYINPLCKSDYPCEVCGDGQMCDLYLDGMREYHDLERGIERWREEREAGGVL
jgi:hypothetical protein